jgi:hypothetical protein
MKRRIPLLPLALPACLLLAACSADPVSVIVTSARAPGDKCDFSDNTKYVAGGSLDLRPYIIGTAPNQIVAVTTQYFQVFSWENNNQSIQTTVNGQVIDNGSGNTFVADSVVYEYQYSDPSVTLATASANMHAAITAGAQPTDNTVPADLIQPAVFTAINGSSAIDTSAQTLLVTFQIFGKLTAGSSQHTNKVSFPVSVYRSSTTPLDCPSQGLVINGGVCNIPGRDQVVSCKKP